MFHLHRDQAGFHKLNNNNRHLFAQGFSNLAVGSSAGSSNRRGTAPLEDLGVAISAAIQAALATVELPTPGPRLPPTLPLHILPVLPPMEFPTMEFPLMPPPIDLPPMPPPMDLPLMPPPVEFAAHLSSLPRFVPPNEDDDDDDAPAPGSSVAVGTGTFMCETCAASCCCCGGPNASECPAAPPQQGSKEAHSNVNVRGVPTALTKTYRDLIKAYTDPMKMN